MKKFRLLLSLPVMALVCLYPGAGADLKDAAASDQEYNWFAWEAPGDAGRLKDVGVQAAPQKSNSLSITDSTGSQARTSLEIPSGGWAYLRLEPAFGGELNLYCLYPTGSVDHVLSETVQAGRAYQARYQAELEGDYKLWFTVDGTRSNSVSFQVREEEVMMEGSAPAGRGAAMPVAYSIGAPAAGSIGLSTGGAKDINNFRENIEQGYLPLPTDVTYEGLYYDYYFETGQAKECKKLFCPSYSYAVSKDPISGEPQHYLSVGLNSGVQDFQRKKLNLMVVLDFSGSMGSRFDKYYYDRFGNKQEAKKDGSGRTKMQIADQSVVALLGHLKDDDRFGLVVFSDDAFLVDPLTRMGDKDRDLLEKRILKINETRGTNMEAGMRKGTALLDRFMEADKSEYENRIIFLTDAMPNLGETGDLGLFRSFEDNADHGIYTTFIGMGVDFNTELIEAITKIKGANYYSVHSADEFKERMDDEFDFMVTPLVFDLRLDLDSAGYRIEKVYGSPEADLATGELMKVNTLFPSQAVEGQVKGGVILVKLQKLSEEGDLLLKVSYRDRNGVADGDEVSVEIPSAEPDFYQNNGIRKAILLSRYADLLKNWMIDERKAAALRSKVVPSVTLANGIVIPVELGEWERQSLPLQVAEPYRKLFGEFGDYFRGEMRGTGDEDLQQEQMILEKLKDCRGSGRTGA